MDKFYAIIKDIVQADTSALLTSETDPIRAIFSGLPAKMLEKLFIEMVNETDDFLIERDNITKSLPVLLVDSRITLDPETIRSGRCSHNHLVTIRNSNDASFLGLVNHSNSTNKSSETSVQNIGILRNDFDSLDEWLAEKIVQQLIDEITKKFRANNKKAIDTLVYTYLHEAWESEYDLKERSVLWNDLESLFEISHVSDSLESLFVNAGIPSLDSEAEEHAVAAIKLPHKIASFYVSNGFTNGTNQLIEELSESDAHLATALLEFVKSIKLSCLTPDDFSKRPIAEYAKAVKIDNIAWPHVLTTETWIKILDGTGELEEYSSIDVICTNALFTPMSLSHPIVVNAPPKFEIKQKDYTKDISVNVIKASGNKVAFDVDTITLSQESLLWQDSEEQPEHNRFVKYQFVSEEIAKPLISKIIDLRHYEPKLAINCRSANRLTPFKLKKQKRKSAKKELTFECDIEVNGTGAHTVDIYFDPNIKLPKTIKSGVDSESESVEKNINLNDSSHAVCLLDVDQDLAYEFIAYNEQHELVTFVLNFSVGDFTPKGVENEFRKLVLQSIEGNSASKVEVRPSMLTMLEQWIVESNNSFYPVIIGPGLKNQWSKPKWKEQPTLSDLKVFLDPRPTFDFMNKIIPPKYKDARTKINTLLKLKFNSGDSIDSINLAILYLEPEFRTAVDEYIFAYVDWITKDDTELAVWTDIITIHSEEGGNGCLYTIPDAIMLSPMHPVKLAWQCNAQLLLEEAINKEIKTPAAGIIDPSGFPSCLVLPCLNANTQKEYFGFASVRTSSDYWSVLWNVNSTSKIGSPEFNNIFNFEFGLSIDGMAQGFSVQQVKRSLDDVKQLASAKSLLSISLTTDIPGESSCNSGIKEWCEQNMGVDNDEWIDGGAMAMRIFDTRPSNTQPEPAILASLTAKSGTNVRWYSREKREISEKRDLSIIDHLKTMNNRFEQHSIKSPVDPTVLFRVNVKRSFTNNYNFIAESRVGEFHGTASDLDLRKNLILALEFLETNCSIKYGMFDSQVFAPNLSTLKATLENTDFLAVSSSTIDASCFHIPEFSSFLWDYELPKYSAKLGLSSGYYLLAKESDNMHLVLNNALEEFKGVAAEANDESISLLREISLRGMPTLKKLTGGGTASFGEIGMLVALRLLQTEFQDPIDYKGILPVNSEQGLVNLIIPADIFQPRFDHIRECIKDKSLDRPDLLSLSIRFNSQNSAISMKICCIEVKARHNKMTNDEHSSAIKQAETFNNFLNKMKVNSDLSALEGVGWREMVSSWVDYGFRIYGEVASIKQNANDWSSMHQNAISQILSSELEIEIASEGRLISIEKVNHGHLLNSKNSDINNIIVLSHDDAGKLLTECQNEVINEVKAKVNDWGLYADKFISVNQNEQSTGLKLQPNEEPAAPSPEEPSTENINEKGKKAEENTLQVDTDDQYSTGIRFKVGEALNRFGDKDIFYYPGNTALNNINIGVVGDLGTGKTQMLKALVYQFVKEPESNRGVSPKVLILDYKRDFSDASDKNCKFIDKAKVKVIKPKDIPLNMFNTSDCLSGTPWLDRYSFFRDVLGKIFSSKGAVQDANLKAAVKACYQKAKDRDPNIYEVFDEYQAILDGKVDSIYGILSDIVDYEIFERNPDKIVPFEEFFDGVVAIDLNEFTDEKLKNLVIVIFLNFYYEYMMKISKKPFLGTKPQTRFIDSYLLVDEAHNIMQYEFPVLTKLLLQGRQFGVGVILASQYFSHFKTSKENYVEPIPTWFVHKVPGIKTNDMDRIGLPTVSNQSVNKIASLGVFESLCKTLDCEGEFIRGIPFFKLD